MRRRSRGGEEKERGLEEKFIVIPCKVKVEKISLLKSILSYVLNQVRPFCACTTSPGDTTQVHSVTGCALFRLELHHRYWRKARRWEHQVLSAFVGQRILHGVEEAGAHILATLPGAGKALTCSWPLASMCRLAAGVASLHSSGRGQILWKPPNAKPLTPHRVHSHT